MNETVPHIDIRPDHWAIVRDILKKHVPHHEVWAFGSRATWQAKPYSDLDLAIITEQPLSLAVSAELADAFSESDLPWKVDVVDWATTSESFREIIERDKVVVQKGIKSLGMEDESKTTALDSLCELIADCPHSTPVWTTSGVIVLRSQNIRGGRLDLSNPSYTDEQHFQDRIRRAEPTAGDLVITREAPMGEVCEIPPGLRCCLGQRMVLLRPDHSKAVSRYLLFALQSSAVQAQIMWAEGTGSTVSNLRIPDLKKLKIPSPPLVEQRAIAHILGTLDDKIELNRNRNETLEAMARALFKDWFVDFGPVRAKMEGRAPYLPPDLWNLFPDRLDDDGKPEGWEMVPASELIDFNPTEPLRKGTPAPYLDMASLPTSGSWPDPPVIRDYGSGMRFRNGDTLMARITPCLENGKTAFVQCLPDDTVGWGSTEYIVMRPKAPVPAGYAYLAARDDTFREHAIRSMTGTSGRQRAQGDSIATFKLASPPDENLWQAFARHIAPAFESIKSNAKASETLSEIRDTLLPKLISGELRIADAENLIERAEVQAPNHEKSPQ